MEHRSAISYSKFSNTGQYIASVDVDGIVKYVSLQNINFNDDLEKESSYMFFPEWSIPRVGHMERG